jgi:hypothetical protein
MWGLVTAFPTAAIGVAWGTSAVRCGLRCWTLGAEEAFDDELPSLSESDEVPSESVSELDSDSDEVDDGGELFRSRRVGGGCFVALIAGKPSGRFFSLLRGDADSVEQQGLSICP